MTTEDVHMVFALDQESKPTPIRTVSAYVENWYSVTKCALDLSRPQTRFERQVFSAVEAAENLQYVLSGSFCKLPHLASTLVADGYCCNIREALGGGRGCASFENLRHEYLLVSNGSETIVVDPHFLSQFSVVAPSACYSAALQISERFVGSMARLITLVTFLCGEMASSFQIMGFTMPPWRQRRAMLSKWLPLRATTHRILPVGSKERILSSQFTEKALLTDKAAVLDRAVSATCHEELNSAAEAAALCINDSDIAKLQLPSAAVSDQVKFVGGHDDKCTHQEMGSTNLCVGGKHCSCPSCKIWQRLTGERSCSMWPPIRTVKMRGKPVLAIGIRC